MVYLTTQEKKPLPTHVKINSSKYPSTVLCEQIDTVNKDKVGDYIGQCSMAEMKKIDAALAVSIGIGINIKSNDLVKKWAEAANEAVKIFGKPEEILNKFDFTITKFAYYKEEVEDETGAVAKRQELPFETLEDEHFLEEIGIPETHIEYKILMDDAFFEHLHLKRIVIDKDIPFPMSTFERMLRYAKYGYFPCKETKMKIINALRDLTDEQVELSESLYDGMD